MSKRGDWIRDRVCASNSEDVYPTLCVCIAKGVSNQLAMGGGFILEYLKKNDLEGYRNLIERLGLRK